MTEDSEPAQEPEVESVKGRRSKRILISVAIAVVIAVVVLLAVMLSPKYSPLASIHDADGDGVVDGDDAFPNDASETTDTDDDGYGDNCDCFPEDENEWIDSDKDGVGDNSDEFPNDPDEWLDTDGDGYGDNSDPFPYGSDVLIKNPTVNLPDFTIYELEEMLSNPSAGHPTYVFLVRNEDGVRLNGPTISSAVNIELADEHILKVGYDYFEDYYLKGYEVRVNSNLTYTVEIADFEDEINLATVELAVSNEFIYSSFVFVAVGDGVAHDVRINAVVDGVIASSTTPITIESR